MTVTGFLFMLAFLGTLALALIRHPIYGLYAYVAVFYVHPPSRWWGAFLPDLRWSLLAAAVTLLALVRLPKNKEVERPSWLSMTPAWIFILYAGWLWVQNLWTLNKAAQMEISLLFTKYILLFYLIYRLVQSQEEIRRFMFVHIAGCCYLGWLAFSSDVSGRLEGVGGPGIDEANALAMQLATGAMMGSMVILAQRRWIQWLCIAGMAFVLNGIVLAGSRGAFLGVLAAGLTMMYLKPPNHKRLFYSFAALGVVLFLVLAPREFWERMGTITAVVDENAQIDNSAESRLVLINAQVKMAQQYPLGAGHRGTEALSREYLEEKYLAMDPGLDPSQRARSSHNTFMTTLVEQGIPGAIMYLTLWVWCARTLRRLRGYAREHWSPVQAAELAGLGGALAVVFVASIFVDYLKAEIQIWLFALLSSFLALSMQRTTAATRAAEALPSQDLARAPAPPGGSAAHRAASSVIK